MIYHVSYSYIVKIYNAILPELRLYVKTTHLYASHNAYVHIYVLAYNNVIRNDTGGTIHYPDVRDYLLR